MSSIYKKFKEKLRRPKNYKQNWVNNNNGMKSYKMKTQNLRPKNYNHRKNIQNCIKISNRIML